MSTLLVHDEIEHDASDTHWDGYKPCDLPAAGRDSIPINRDKL
ncbi:hypothetical protein [Lunatimonas salinarum]|nr:hypothetical protein [Lunatimonas salinarum]